jgi:hypothetical protein
VAGLPPWKGKPRVTGMAVGVLRAGKHIKKYQIRDDKGTKN